LLLFFYAVIILISGKNLTFAAKPSDNAVFYFALCRIIIGIFFAVFIFSLQKTKITRTFLVAILFIGFLVRLILIFSQPILEDDYNRYLWDGATFSHGINPYKYSPLQIMQNESDPESEISRLIKLEKESGPIFHRINNAYLRTSYPIFSQIVFAVSYLIKPWSITVWKLLLLLFDIVTIFLIIRILTKLKLPLVLLSIYWLNPIVIHEFFNAGHMDVLTFPFVLQSILFYLNRKLNLASIFLSLAIGFKIWPILLFPLLFKKLSGNKKYLLFSLLSLIAVVLIVTVPLLETQLDSTLGLIKYSTSWENNDAVYRIIDFLIENILMIFNKPYFCSLCITRWVTVILVLITTFYFAIKEENINNALIVKSFFIIAVLFFLSPTEFPWYYTWAVIFLVFTPNLSFVLYPAFLPLFQLKYRWEFLIYIEHLPVLIIFIWEFAKGRSSFYQRLVKANR